MEFWVGHLFVDTRRMTFCHALTLKRRREERNWGRGEEREEDGKGRQSWTQKGEKERGRREKGGDKREESRSNSCLFYLKGTNPMERAHSYSLIWPESFQCLYLPISSHYKVELQKTNLRRTNTFSQ